VHSQPHTVLIEIQTNYLHTLDYRQTNSLHSCTEELQYS